MTAPNQNKARDKACESVPDQTVGAEANLSSSRVRRRAPVRILVVAEDDVLQRTLARLLSRSGFAVVLAGTAEAAVALAGAFPQPHLVVVDGDAVGIRQPASWAALAAAAGEVPILWLYGGSSAMVAGRSEAAAVHTAAKDEPWEKLRRIVDRLAGDRAIRVGELVNDEPDQ